MDIIILLVVLIIIITMVGICGGMETIGVQLPQNIFILLVNRHQILVLHLIIPIFHIMNIIGMEQNKHMIH